MWSRRGDGLEAALRKQRADALAGLVQTGFSLLVTLLVSLALIGVGMVLRRRERKA